MIVADLRNLRRIPGVGPSLAPDLADLGIRRVVDLRRRSPERLYGKLCALRGKFKLILYVAALLVAGAGCHTVSESETSLPSEIVRFRGAARYSRDGKSWHDIRPRDVLSPGCIVQTATNETGFLDIVLGETREARSVVEEARVVNFVRIWGNSILRIEKLSTMRDFSGDLTAKLFLLSGRMSAYVTELPPGSSYVVGLTNGVVHPKGNSWYELTASGELRVFKGAVAFVLKDRNRTVEVSAGNRFAPSTGLIADAQRKEFESWVPKLMIAPGAPHAPAAPPGPVLPQRPAAPARSF